MDKMYREKRIKKINPVYAIGLTWLVYGFIFPLYRFTDLMIASALSVIAYLAAKRFLPERSVVLPLTEKGSVDERCVEIIELGYGYIATLEQLKAALSDREIAGRVEEIIAISRQMLDYTAKNPRIATELRNFIDYYYPTTIKLLGVYRDMDEQGLKSKNVGDIMEKVRQVMGTVTAAFRKQLNLMYDEKRLDVRTDIEVLKGLLAAEGLADSSAPTL